MYHCLRCRIDDSLTRYHAIAWYKIGRSIDDDPITKLMNLSERLLLLLSRSPSDEDWPEGKTEWKIDHALSILCRVFPNFLDDIRGKSILDHGCGTGHQSVALVRKGAKYVVGIDPRRKVLEEARKLAKENEVEHQVEFRESFDIRDYDRFEIVISQNSMEHYPDPVAVVEEMKSALTSQGKMYITFGPPWCAPYGSHMQFFTKVPWVNILFSEKSVMNVRSKFRSDGATRYEEVEGGLNRMTVAKFESLISNSGAKVHYRRYDCALGLQLLSKLPRVRELFINHISLMLVRN